MLLLCAPAFTQEKGGRVNRVRQVTGRVPILTGNGSGHSSGTPAPRRFMLVLIVMTVVLLTLPGSASGRV